MTGYSKNPETKQTTTLYRSFGPAVNRNLEEARTEVVSWLVDQRRRKEQRLQEREQAEARKQEAEQAQEEAARAKMPCGKKNTGKKNRRKDAAAESTNNDAQNPPKDPTPEKEKSTKTRAKRKSVASANEDKDGLPAALQQKKRLYHSLLRLKNRLECKAFR